MSVASTLKGSLAPGLTQVLAQFGSTAKVTRPPGAETVERNADGSPKKNRGVYPIVKGGAALKMYISPLSSVALQRQWGKDTQATSQGFYVGDVDVLENDVVDVTEGPHKGRTFVVTGRPIVDAMSGGTVIAMEQS